MTRRARQRRLQAWPGGGGGGRRTCGDAAARAPLRFLPREATSLQARCSPSECLLIQQLEQQDASPPPSLPTRPAHPGCYCCCRGTGRSCFRSPPRPGSSRLRPGCGLAVWPWLQPSTPSSSSSSSRRLITSRITVVEAHRAEAAAGAGGSCGVEFSSRTDLVAFRILWRLQKC